MHFKNYLRLAALSSALFFQSCGDDDGPKDITMPEITISGITEGDEVWNTIKLEATATDDIAVAKIELYVDNELITSDETSASIIKAWDTNDVEDGAHTIKAVATDRSGNIAETKINLMVLNTLITISTPERTLANEHSGYVFLSDENGGIIGTELLENNGLITIKNNEFNGETFYLTEAYSNSGTLVLRTFSEINRGSDWTASSLLANNDTDEKAPAVDHILINFENAETGYYYQLFTSTGFYFKKTGNSDKIIAFYDDDITLYVNKFNANNELTASHYFNDIEYTQLVDLSLVKDSPKSVTLDREGKISSMKLYGFNDGDRSHMYTTTFRTNSETNTLYYLDGIFDNYMIHFQQNSSKFLYEQITYGVEGMKYLLDDYTSSLHNLEYEFKTDKVSYNSTGDFDLMDLVLKGNSESTTSNWHFIVPANNEGEIILLDLPELLSDYPQPSKGSSYDGYEFVNVNGYEETLSLLESSTSLNNLKDGGHVYINQYYGF